MATNDKNKLLRKVLSKWAFDELPDDKYNKGQIAIRIAEIKEMLLDMESEARADGYKEGQKNIAKHIIVLVNGGTLYSPEKAIRNVLKYCNKIIER